MFKSTGKLVYDPQFPGQRKAGQFWLMVSVDEQIARYYKWLLLKERCLSINTGGIWGTHISVVRGERDRPKTGWWGSNDGEIVDFEYSETVEGDGTYFWLPVRSQKLAEIRVGYGLSPEPYFPFHLTLGNTL